MGAALAVMLTLSAFGVVDLGGDDSEASEPGVTAPALPATTEAFGDDLDGSGGVLVAAPCSAALGEDLAAGAWSLPAARRACSGDDMDTVVGWATLPVLDCFRALGADLEAAEDLNLMAARRACSGGDLARVVAILATTVIADVGNCGAIEEIWWQIPPGSWAEQPWGDALDAHDLCTGPDDRAETQAPRRACAGAVLRDIEADNYSLPSAEGVCTDGELTAVVERAIDGSGDCAPYEWGWLQIPAGSWAEQPWGDALVAHRLCTGRGLPP